MLWKPRWKRQSLVSNGTPVLRAMTPNSLAGGSTCRRCPQSGARTWHRSRTAAAHELKYTHFSVVMSKSRQLAFFTAVNIDGTHLQDLTRGTDMPGTLTRASSESTRWIPLVYKHPDLDRGHLVRRLDPVWGAEAEEANEDTFHFTNCSPQHSKLNRKTWLGLE